MFIKLTHMANGYKGEVGKPVTGKPNLCPIETKDLYYPNIAISESGGAGIAPIPDIDRDKIIEVLDSRFKTQLRMYLIELYSVTGKLTEKQENDIKDYMKESADEIIKAIRGEE